MLAFIGGLFAGIFGIFPFGKKSEYLLEFDNKYLHKLNIIFDGQYLFTSAKKKDNGNGVVLGIILYE